MRTLLIRTLIGSSLLFGGVAANAQYDRRPDYGWQDREPTEHSRVLDRVRNDLNNAEAATIPFTADRSRIVAARESANAFQRRLADGDYDRDELQNAINQVARVVDLNRLSDSMRSYLSDDLAGMQNLRDRLDREWR